MPFEFIDNTRINSSTRKKIRAHVMMKKNLGKTRPPRMKAVAAQVKTSMPMTAPKAISDEEISLLPLSQQVGDEFSVYPFPAELTLRSRGLVYKCKVHGIPASISAAKVLAVIQGVGDIINQENICCRSVDVSTSIWIRYIFLDEACTYFLLCITDDTNPE